MDGLIDIDSARALVSDAALWPRVRDFLWNFAPQVHPSWLENHPTIKLSNHQTILNSPRISRWLLAQLHVEPCFHPFPSDDLSRLLLLDSSTLVSIAHWLGALASADALRRVTRGTDVAALKTALPGVYPAVFSYAPYFAKSALPPRHRPHSLRHSRQWLLPPPLRPLPPPFPPPPPPLPQTPQRHSPRPSVLHHQTIKPSNHQTSFEVALPRGLLSMLLVNKQNFALASDRRLVKATDVATARTAAEIIADAEAEAARIREEAISAAEDEKRRGYEKGLADAQQEMALKKLELVDSSVTFMESVERKMADVVLKALKTFVVEVGDEAMVLQIVRKTLNAVIRTQRQVTLKVSPEMKAAVTARVAELKAAYPTVETFDVVDDPRLKGPACILETEAGVADASVATQLAAIEKSIERHLGR